MRLRIEFVLQAALSVISVAAAQTNRDFDPFAIPKQTAQARKAEWDVLDQKLDLSLQRVHPCSKEAREIIQQVKSAALISFQAKSHYYDDWDKALKNDEKTNDRLLQEHSSLRQAALADITVIKLLSDNIKHRTANLEEADKEAATISTKKASEMLDKQLGELARRLDQAQSAIYYSDRVVAARANGKEILRSEQEYVNRLKAALGTESLSWQSYYEAYEARRFLECVGQSSPDDLGTKRLPRR